MLNDAMKNVFRVRGTLREMRRILEHRRNLVDGFGVPVTPPKSPTKRLRARLTE